MFSHVLTLLVPAGLFCSNFLSNPLFHSLMLEPRLLSCTQPSKKKPWEKKQTPAQVAARFTQCAGQAGEVVLPLVPHLLDEEGSGSSGQPSAVGARQEIQASLISEGPDDTISQSHSPIWRVIWECSSEMPSPFLQHSCEAKALRPQPHLTQQVLHLALFTAQQMQLLYTCPANFSLTAAARCCKNKLLHYCREWARQGKHPEQVIGSDYLNSSASLLHDIKGPCSSKQASFPHCLTISGVLCSCPAREPTTSSTPAPWQQQLYPKSCIPAAVI